jgi:hypothetical protein
VLTFLLDLQEAHPDQIFLTLGNHEIMIIKGQLHQSKSLSYRHNHRDGRVSYIYDFASCNGNVPCQDFLLNSPVRRAFFMCGSPLRSRLNALPAIRLIGRTISMHAGLSTLWADQLIRLAGDQNPIDFFNGEMRKIARGLCIPANYDAGQVDTAMMQISDRSWFANRRDFYASPFDESVVDAQQHPMTPPMWYRGYSNLGVAGVIMPQAGHAAEIYNRFVDVQGVMTPLYDQRAYPIPCFNAAYGQCSATRIWQAAYCARTLEGCLPKPEYEPAMTVEQALEYVLDKFNADRMVLGHSIVDGIKHMYGCRLFLIDIMMSQGFGAGHTSPQVLLLDDENPDGITVVAAPRTGTETLPPVPAPADCSAHTIRFELIDDGEVVLHNDDGVIPEFMVPY